MAELEKNCTVLIEQPKGDIPSSQDIQKQLESSKVKDKINALESLLLLMINGEPYPKLLMSIIRFIVPNPDHRVKKLCMLYWEIVDKTKEDGQLREEMILVCQALRNDLTHPNEFEEFCTVLCEIYGVWRWSILFGLWNLEDIGCFGFWDVRVCVHVNLERIWKSKSCFQIINLHLNRHLRSPTLNSISSSDRSRCQPSKLYQIISQRPHLISKRPI